MTKHRCKPLPTETTTDRNGRDEEWTDSGLRVIRGWTNCVGPRDCDGRPHGGVVIVDECACGRIRITESNGCHTATRGWGSAAEAD